MIPPPTTDQGAPESVVVNHTGFLFVVEMTEHCPAKQSDPGANEMRIRGQERVAGMLVLDPTAAA
jgi:hypothetical protein